MKEVCKHIGTKLKVQSKHTLHLFTRHHDNPSPAVLNIPAWGAVITVTKHTLDLSHILNTHSQHNILHLIHTQRSTHTQIPESRIFIILNYKYMYHVMLLFAISTGSYL